MFATELDAHEDSVAFNGHWNFIEENTNSDVNKIRKRGK